MSTTPKASTAKYIGDLHHEQMMWLNTLQFRKEETAILERPMEDVVRRSNQPDVMAELEHFQVRYVSDQCIRQQEVMDELRHDVKAHENGLAKDHPVAMDQGHFADHSGLRERM